MTTTQDLPAIGTTVTASQPGSALAVIGTVVGYCTGNLAGFVQVKYADRHGGHSVGRFHASRCEAVYTAEEEAKAAVARAVFADLDAAVAPLADRIADLQRYGRRFPLTEAEADSPEVTGYLTAIGTRFFRDSAELWVERND